jgi:hypothetical protein
MINLFGDSGLRHSFSEKIESEASVMTNILFPFEDGGRERISHRNMISLSTP